MPVKLKKSADLLILIISICLLAVAIFYCANKLVHVFNGVPFDMSFFLTDGNRFQEEGVLFKRASTVEEMAWIYAPSGCCNWKYPPIGEVLLLPYTQGGIDEFYRIIPGLNVKVMDPESFVGMRLMMLSCYFISIIIILKSVLKETLKNAGKIKISLFVIVSVVVFLATDPIFFLLDSLNYEIIVFLMVVIATVIPGKFGFLSGSIIGLASSVKIYPIILIFYFVLKKDVYGVVGFILGAAVGTVIGLYFFGAQENIYFWTEVFPVMLREQSAVADYNLSVGRLIMRFAGDDYRIFFYAFKFIFLLLCMWTISFKKEINAIKNMSIMLIAMLCFLQNYWSSYQVYLLLPLIYLFGHNMAIESRGGLAVLMICAFLLFLDFGWVDESRTMLADSTYQFPYVSAFEMTVKLKLFRQPAFPSFIFWLFQLKSLVPFVMLFMLATSPIQSTELLQDPK